MTQKTKLVDIKWHKECVLRLYYSFRQRFVMLKMMPSYNIPPTYIFHDPSVPLPLSPSSYDPHSLFYLEAAAFTIFLTRSKLCPSNPLPPLRFTKTHSFDVYGGSTRISPKTNIDSPSTHVTWLHALSNLSNIFCPSGDAYGVICSGVVCWVDMMFE